MTDLRVTTGSLRGRRIPLPRHGIRPTSERARQAYFDIVGPRLEGARFLDLFAGSGAFAFEAVSRGASSALAIDSSRPAVESINRLAQQWNAEVVGRVAEVFAALGKPLDFDLAYADPPYDFDRYDDLVAAIDAAAGDCSPLVAIEHRRKSEPFQAEPPRLRRIRRAEYGEIWITFFEMAAE